MYVYTLRLTKLALLEPSLEKHLVFLHWRISRGNDDMVYFLPSKVRVLADVWIGENIV